MPVVDSHVHLLPEPLDRRVRELFDQFGPGRVVYPLAAEAVLEQLHAEGVTTAWLLPYAHRPGVATWMNEATAALRQRLDGAPVALVAGATVHPGDDDPGDIVSQAVVDLGARVLKLHCAVGGFDLADPRLEAVWERCVFHRLPVVVHAGHDHFGHTATVDLGGLPEVAARHDQLRLIVAHLGHPATRDVVEVMDRHPNVYADLTPVVAAPVEVTATDLARLGERLLFGSDAPNTGIRVASLLTRLREAGLDDATYGSITSGNASRLVDAVRTDPWSPTAR
jgi:uncharacterized protein